MGESQRARLTQIVIKKNGVEISPETYDALLSVMVRNAINTVPFGRLVFADWFGEVFDWMGAPVEIGVTDPDNPRRFNRYLKGEIVRVSHARDASQDYKCVVEVRHQGWRLGLAQKFHSYVESKASDVASKIAGNAGLSPELQATTRVFKQLMQCNESDLDFLHRVLESEGQCFWFDAAENKLHTSDALKFQTAALELSSSDRPAITLEHRPSWCKVGIGGWDFAHKEPVRATGDVPSPHGNLKFDNLLSLERTPALDVAGDAETWKKAAVARAEGDRSRVTLAYMGKPAPVGQKITKAPASRARDKEVAVSLGVIESEWRYDQSGSEECRVVGVDLSTGAGHSPNYLPPRSAPRPVLAGLHIGIVTSVADNLNDAAGDIGRIKVKFPAWSSDYDFWARVAQPMASPKRGTLFYPEVNDEVLVAFTDGDPDHPVVVGSLYNGKDKPIEPACGKHHDAGKTVGTSIWDGKNELSFNKKDGAEKIYLKDTATNSLVMDTANKQIDLKNVDGKIIINAGDNAKITLDAKTGDITIECNNLKVKAKANAEIEATGNVNLKATADAAIEGMNFNAKANATAKVAGTASAEISASGQTTVKGAMVMIN